MRWVLRQGPAAITCEVDLRPDRTFEIAVIPSSPGTPPLRERFSGPLRAMERHAEIAATLCAAGWIVGSRSTRGHGVAA